MSERIIFSNRCKTETDTSSAIFLDRDGVINLKPDTGCYVENPNELTMNPGIYDIFSLIDPARYLILVVTNQRGIARGMVTRDNFALIMNKINNFLIAKVGFGLDAVYYCPHDIEDSSCNCRKPKPGMFITATNDYNLQSGIMIGDTENDIEAARRAGFYSGIIVPTDHPETAIPRLKLWLNK